MPQGLILFAHGARDARWTEPFLRLRERVAKAVPEARVVLAYLELMAPDLPAAAAQLHGAGCRRILLVPIFLGQGGHIREDVPRQLQAVSARHPDCEFRMAEAAGEDDAVIDALAAYCLKQLTDRP